MIKGTQIFIIIMIYKDLIIKYHSNHDNPRSFFFISIK
jgi:hypothetical protein